MKTQVFSAFLVAAIAQISSSSAAQCEVQKILVGTPGAAGKDVLFVRSAGDSGAGSYAGACYVFERSGTGWVQVQKLIGSDTTTGDGFGNNVSLSGDTAVITAPNDDDLGSESGSAYVFERQPTGWVQTDKLIALDGSANDQFGTSVAIDGDTIAVGAWTAPYGGVQSGAAYVFQRVDGVWGQTAKLGPSDGHAGDGFGESIDLSGTTVLVASEENANQKGAAYVYDLGPSGWQETAKVVPSDAIAGDEFGTSVGLDGNLAVISAGKDDDGVDSGSGYVFDLLPGGWQQAQKLLPSDGEPSHYFGNSVVLHAGVAYVGADGGPGTAYLFLDPAGVSLWGCPPTLSLASGGTQQLRLGAGADHADEVYLLLGSLSGTVPGTPVGSVHVPLNVDAYSFFVVAHANQPPYSASLGTLSSSGVALTKLTLAAGTNPSLVGTLLFHAQILFDPLTGAPTFASNAAPLTLLP